MRVLIADDESLARASLRSILQELPLPLRIIGEATNGEELLELVKQYAPDIAFVDIRMPHMNGLDAIKAGQVISPETRWFILTGFSEFDYAKEAVRLGAADYLLKPVDPAELEAVLRKVYEGYGKQIAGLNKQFERDMMALYHGINSLRWEDEDSYLPGMEFIGQILYVDSHLLEKPKSERQIALLRGVRTCIEQSLANGLRITLFALPDGNFVIIAAWKTRDLGRHQAERFLHDVEKFIHCFDDDDFRATGLRSNPCSSFDALRARLDRLQELADLRAVAGIGRTWDGKRLEELSKNAAIMNVAPLLIRLSEGYRDGNYLDFMRILPKLRQALGSHLSPDLKSGMVEFLRCGLHCEVHRDQPDRAWLHSLEQCAEQLLTRSPQLDQHDLISRVVAFVDAYYQSDIGVGQIAEQLGITPNYLSAMFHKKTGVTFVKYLTQTRMLKAKALLLDSTLSIQKVAEQSGYANTRYFTKLFTEFANCTPSEFRRAHIAEF